MFRKREGTQKAACSETGVLKQWKYAKLMLRNMKRADIISDAI